MFQNERFVMIIKKTKTMVICMLILGIFGDFQNFQIFRFQIPEKLEILWKLLHLRYCKILGIFGEFQNFQISRFQIPENLEILWKLLHLTNCKILGIFLTQFWSLSLIFHSEFLNFIFLEFPDSRFSGIWNLEIPGKCKFKNSE